MKRRTFIKKTSISLPLSVAGVNIAASYADSMASIRSFNTESDKVLVLVQLNGGNDGLNTLIPVDQYDKLFQARKNIIIPENKILKLEDHPSVGLHPSLTAIRDLFNDGKVGIAQNVGYPNPNKSHFRSTDIWTTASDADVMESTGWVGRYLSDLHPQYPAGYPNDNNPDPLAISIDTAVSATCQSSAVNMSATVPNLNKFITLPEFDKDETSINTSFGRELDFIKQSITQSNAYNTVLEKAAKKGKTLSVKYPQKGENKLADQLQIVAHLIAGGLSTKIYIVKLGGFDTHDSQTLEGSPTAGLHAALMSKLSTGVDAFLDDLKLLGINNRVVLMTFSEFGRRIKSNNSFGTDHGEAAPLFVFGDLVNPKIHGNNPSIPDQVTKNDNVPMQIDFRSVYASLLMDMFSVSLEDAKRLINPNITYIPLLKNAGQENILSAKSDQQHHLRQNYPNPFKNTTSIDFKTMGGRTQLEILNTNGETVKVVFSKKLSKGKHSIAFDGSDLVPGTYIYRLINGDNIAHRTMTKI